MFLALHQSTVVQPSGGTDHLLHSQVGCTDGNKGCCDSNANYAVYNRLGTEELDALNQLLVEKGLSSEADISGMDTTLPKMQAHDLLKFLNEAEIDTAKYTALKEKAALRGIQDQVNGKDTLAEKLEIMKNALENPDLSYTQKAKIQQNIELAVPSSIVNVAPSITVETVKTANANPVASHSMPSRNFCCFSWC